MEATSEATGSMKVLPMHQPWAQLVVMGYKTVETRPRPTPKSMKGLVAVHANKTDEFLHLRDHPFFARRLAGVELPLGHIIGTVEIIRSVTINEPNAAYLENHRPEEFAFGDYTPGRFGWVLRNGRQVVSPIPFKAHQGWPDVADEIVKAVAL